MYVNRDVVNPPLSWKSLVRQLLTSQPPDLHVQWNDFANRWTRVLGKFDRCQERTCRYTWTEVERTGGLEENALPQSELTSQGLQPCRKESVLHIQPLASDNQEPVRDLHRSPPSSTWRDPTGSFVASTLTQHLSLSARYSISVPSSNLFTHCLQLFPLFSSVCYWPVPTPATTVQLFMITGLWASGSNMVKIPSMGSLSQSPCCSLVSLGLFSPNTHSLGGHTSSHLYHSFPSVYAPHTSDHTSARLHAH